MLQLGRSLLGDRHWAIPAGSELLQAPKPPTNNWLTSLLFCKCQQQSSGKISSLPPSCNALADMRQQIKIGRLKLALTRLKRADGHKYKHPDFACCKTVGWKLCPFTHLLRSRSDQSVPDLGSRILQVFTKATRLSSLSQEYRAQPQVHKCHPGSCQNPDPWKLNYKSTSTVNCLNLWLRFPT